MTGNNVFNMEFGDFNRLPESDQDYVNKILFSAANTCKSGKRPEFCWIENVENGPSSVGEAGYVSDKGIITDMPNLLPQAPFQAPAIGVLPPQMIPAYYPVPVIGYGHGVPVAVPVATAGMMPSPMMYSYPPPPTAAVPMAPVFTPETQHTSVTPHGVNEDASRSHNNAIMSESNNVHDSTIPRSDSQSSGTDKPRRNKKKRPAGYYEQLEAQSTGSHGMTENDLSHHESHIQDRSVHPVSSDNSVKHNMLNNCERVAPVINNPQHSVHSHENNFQHVQQSFVQENYSDSLSRTQTIQQEISNSHRAETSSHITFVQNNSLTDDTSSEITQEPTISIEHESCYAKSQDPTFQCLSNTNLPRSGPNANTVNSAKSDVRDTQTDLSENESTLSSIKNEDHQNANSSNSITNESRNNISLSSDNNIVASDTDKCTSQSEGNVNDATITINDGQVSSTSEAKPPIETEVPKKPGSWAGLFSSTKQAKSATVIYTERKASEVSGLQLANESAPKKEQTSVPVLVPVADDKGAPVIAERVVGHRLNHKAQALVPRGLTNRKNWCYVNATLQALLACPPFYHLLKALPVFPKCGRGPTSTPFTDALVRYVNEFSNMHGHPDTQKVLNAKGTMKMDVPQGATFEPTYVYDVLRLDKYASSFILGRQEDAEEFLGCLLNGMHEELVGVLNPQPLPPAHEEAAVVESNGEKSGGDEDAGTGEAEDGWSQVGPKNKAVVTRSVATPGHRSSPVSEIFQGQIRSILQQSGQRESATLQPFYTLQLDIQSEKVRSVRDALENLVKKESLQDFTCMKTKQEIEASRRIMLETLPSVLVLHLKYFVFDKSGGSQKLTKHIEYPIDLEFNKEFLSPNIRSKLQTSQRKYKLFAVVNHHGARLLGGHYTTYVYHCGLGGWIHIDDELVRTVQTSAMLKHYPPRVPYLLYYRKVDLQ